SLIIVQAFEIARLIKSKSPVTKPTNVNNKADKNILIFSQTNDVTSFMVSQAFEIIVLIPSKIGSKIGAYVSNMLLMKSVIAVHAVVAVSKILVHTSLR